MLKLKNDVSESICLLNLQSLTEDELKRLKFLMDEIHAENQWPLFLDLVKLNACDSLVYLNIQKYNLPVPANVQTEIKKTYEKIANENALRNAEAKLIFTTLYQRQIPFVILKGQALADSMYASLYYKKMNDVDFIVQKSSLDSLDAIYTELNLQCAASLGGGSHRKQEKFSHHWPPFFTRTMDCVLGTHWNIITPLSKIKIAETDLWINTVPHSYLGIPCLRLNDLYFFFHLVLHLAYYKTGLKELCDPINWYRAKKTSIDGHAFLNLVRTTGAYDPVYRSLSLIHTIQPDPVIAHWIDELRPNTDDFVIADTHFRCRELYYVVRSRSTQTSRIEKNYALFSLADMFYEKSYFLFKMWKHFLWPKRKDIIYMQSLPDKPGLLTLGRGYFRTPYLLSRVFAFDLGWKLHFLLIAKHHVDLLKSFVHFILSVVTFGILVPFPKTLSRKIKSLNLPLDSIEQIKTKLE